MNTRKKRIKVSNDEYVDHDDPDEHDELRKSRIRDSNKEFARRMTILQSWSKYWSDYSTREGEAYPQADAKEMIRKSKKISCPIANCDKTFTTVAGLKYHYARCNIERCFKCHVCQPPLSVTTRGELLRHLIINHMSELPELSQEQKDIANSITLSERKSNISTSRKDSKKNIYETEGPQTSHKLISGYRDLNRRIFYSENFKNRPFKDWQLLTKDWELVLHEIDRRRYYPPELESVNFKRARKDGAWTRIRAGHSKVLNKDKREVPLSSVFFTGGINSAMAWLPKPMTRCETSSEPELVAIAVNCCAMDKSLKYRETAEGTYCIQFWSIGSNQSDEGSKEHDMNCQLSYMVGHNHGVIFDMAWCPLGTSWQSAIDFDGIGQPRVGLLALACGDGQVRVLSVPHTPSLLARATSRISENMIESTPIFRVKPIACLMPPGVGQSTGHKNAACLTIAWNTEDNQRLIAAGYSNGNVALFDLANGSPILYSNVGNRHFYQPSKSWSAHGAPVTGITLSSISSDRTLVATGSSDRQVIIWNPKDLSTCQISDRAPVTKILWDYRFRGIVSASETAFTSFNNRVKYRYPVSDGYHQVPVATHRSTVWGLANSIITNAIASSDQAGEVFVAPQFLFRVSQKKDRDMGTHSLYTMKPRALDSVASNTQSNGNAEGIADDGLQNLIIDIPNDEVQNENCEDEEDAAEPDFSAVERNVANKPTKFLLPLGHRAVETYSDFKNNFGLEFIHYNHLPNNSSSQPESCIRANDIRNIFCDRNCDYPFSTINLVTWSPNVKTYPYLLTGMRIGLCRLDRVQAVELAHGNTVETILSKNPVESRSRS